VVNDPSSIVLLENGQGGASVVHETKAVVHNRAEILKKIRQTSRETPLDVLYRDIVTAVSNPFGNSHF
jgi:hypothetical protein